MKKEHARRTSFLCVPVAIAVLAIFGSTCAFAQAGTAPSIPQSKLIQPVDLAKTLQGSGRKPAILQIGPHMLFTQGHIPGAEYVGAASTPEGLEKLKARAKTLKKSDAIVLYCGCCPWEHCPNVAPAYEELRKEGFSNVKVLYIASNFGADWVYKGYPTAKGD